ncbi:hypothetical protein AOA77_09820 [Pseudomonas paraeruginosa]|nr:hypothetical protein AN920_06790 [Pseudomonas paraeruginosa]KQB33053.1 hypothetical protein AOA77_09820 [Pseudomonas paraeruginosa]
MQAQAGASVNASTSRSITARTQACLLAPAVDGKPEDQPFKGYEICVFPDALDTGANLEIGYMPGPLPWLVSASWPPSPSSKRSPADPPAFPATRAGERSRSSRRHRT